MDASDLQAWGLQCLDAVESASQQVKEGHMEQAQSSLKAIGSSAHNLQIKVSDMKQKLEEREKKLIDKEEAIQIKIGSLYDQVLSLQEQEKDLMVKHQGHQARLHQLQTDLASKKQQLTQAEYDLYKAKKHAKHARHRLGGLGHILDLISNTEHHIHSLKGEESALNAQVAQINSEIKQASDSLSAMQAQIDDVTAQKASAQQEEEVAHGQLGEVKAVLGFVVEAHGIWEEIEVVTDSTSFTTAALQRVVELALGEKQISLHRSGGTALVVNSFRQAWMHLDEFLSSNRVFLGEPVDPPNT